MDFGPVLADLPFLLLGVQATLAVAAASVVLGVAIGLVIAFVRLSRLPVLPGLAATYVAIMQSIPFFALLLWVFFVLPALTGLQLDPFPAGVLALGMQLGAYLGETFRAGILAVPAGQREAGLSTGMRERQVMRRIVLPQAFRNILPTFTGVCVAAVKDSSLVSAVGVTELIWQANAIQIQSFRPVETFLVVAVVYAVLTYPITLVGNWLFQRAWRGA
jgi:His/Glu/Gln/Arg/opine family amino acid ABC transporter permease subunit